MNTAQPAVQKIVCALVSHALTVAIRRGFDPVDFGKAFDHERDLHPKMGPRRILYRTMKRLEAMIN